MDDSWRQFIDPITLKDGSETLDPRLDRLKEFDEASRGFGIAALHDTKPIIPKGWSVRRWFDQKREGACVSFGWHHEAVAVPARASLYYPQSILPSTSSNIGEYYTLANNLIRERYYEMQRRDPWPGGEYPGADPQYGGTSVLTGAKLMKELGYFTEYRWCFTLNDILRAISYEGPVVFASKWLEGMYDPKADGYLDISGEEVGGHCYLLSSVSPGNKRVTMWNSWGQDWGDNGRAFISFDSLEALFYEGGECCVPVGRLVV